MMFTWSHLACQRPSGWHPSLQPVTCPTQPGVVRELAGGALDPTIIVFGGEQLSEDAG